MADAALEILTTLGLADLTMRRLATTLEVQPSALYWHYANKQTLLAALSDRVVNSAIADAPALPAEADWVERSRYLALTLRAQLLAYRDGAELVSSTLALGLGATAPQNLLTASLASGGFSAAIARQGAAVLLHFILGYVTQEQQRGQASALGAAREDSALAVGGEAEFRFGVQLILDGLAALPAQER